MWNLKTGKLLGTIAAAAAIFTAGHYTGKQARTATQGERAGSADFSEPPAATTVSQRSASAPMVWPAPAAKPTGFRAQPTAGPSANPVASTTATPVRRAVRPPPVPAAPSANPHYQTPSQAAQALLQTSSLPAIDQMNFVRAPQYNNVNPSSDELADRAMLVAAEADWRTFLLDESLSLTPAQQQAVFPIYARSSPAYTPLLIDNPALPAPTGSPSAAASILGSTGSVDSARRGEVSNEGELAQQDAPKAIRSENEVLEEIYEILAPDQQEALEQEYLDRDAWWSEIVAVYEGEYDERLEAAARPTVIEDTDDSGGGLFGIAPQNDDTE